jgi:thiol:disulfide interchange protein DsbD
MIRALLLTILLWLSAGLAQARESLPVDTGVTELSLVSDFDTVAPGQSLTVLLRMQLEGDWYTYWRNPGDSGEPVRIDWELPEGISAGPIQWPAPKHKWTGPIASYALAGDVFLPISFTVAEDVTAPTIRLVGKAYYLVCDTLCVPEDGEVSLVLGVGAAEENPRDAARVAAALDAIPKTVGARGHMSRDGDRVVFDLADLPSGSDTPTLYPHDNPLISHSQPVNMITGTEGFRFSAEPGWGWDEDETKATAVTVVQSDGSAFVVPLDDAPVDIGDVVSGAASGGGTASPLGFWAAIFGAFLGGLVLNLMPCVFPIISLKALSLAKTAHGDRGAVRRAGWAYTLGVLVSVLAFAAVIIGLKAAGTTIGWGFQLQSPWLVATLALLLFAIGLNLLGVYEIGGRLQNIGSGTAARASARNPFLGSFLTGVLAVVVATPCTAPFMAGAIGYALASPAILTLLVFLALGLGFALPFLLVAYVPGLLSRLPKPGAWMETFRQFLAFPMFAAAIWLVWVLTLQAGETGLLKLLGAGLLFCFGIWLMRRTGTFAKWAGVAALLFALWLPLSVKPQSASEISTQSWSPERVTALQAEGKTVFVDFTAAWCVTCKVNELGVLKSARTAELFAQTNTEFLIADWTNRDELIAKELARYDRAGVPLYLVFKPGDARGQVLPQVLSYDILKDALE